MVFYCVMFCFFIHCMCVCVCVIFFPWSEYKLFWMVAFPIILFYFTLLLYLYRYEFCSLIACNIFHLKFGIFEIEESNSFHIFFLFLLDGNGRKFYIFTYITFFSFTYNEKIKKYSFLLFSAFTRAHTCYIHTCFCIIKKKLTTRPYFTNISL